MLLNQQEDTSTRFFILAGHHGENRNVGREACETGTKMETPTRTSWTGNILVNFISSCQMCGVLSPWLKDYEINEIKHLMNSAGLMHMHFTGDVKNMKSVM